MSHRDDLVRLHDMLDAARAAIRVLGEHSAEELEQTEVLALAVPHAVEIVGEAAGRVSRAFCDAHPEVPWSEITGMRHRIVHDYFSVDYQRFWDTVHSDLPPPIEQLERLLEDVGDGRNGA